jgi:predicted GH43/DUF377 family glycosyl hydrolase
MILKRYQETLLLRPEDIAPSDGAFEVVGVFNPGAVSVNGEVVLLVRVAERPRERRAGFTPLPRWEPGKGRVIDWVSDEMIDPIDPRVVRRKVDGLVRLTFLSHLRLVRCGDGRSVRELTGIRIDPESWTEEFGVEDARITAIGDRYWITYVAVSRHGASTALASTTDFQTFERHGIIFCVENKDVVLFPDRIVSDYVAIHRPNGATPFTRPEMWLARSQDLRCWGMHEPMSWGPGGWEAGRVGAGPPPIRIPDGWLLIYHGNRAPERPGEVGIYSVGALLLDPNNPARIVKRTPETFFTPTAEFEREGFVPNVVFPTGIVEAGDTLLVYYGAADAFTAVVEFSKAELLSVLR